MGQYELFCLLCPSITCHITVQKFNILMFLVMYLVSSISVEIYSRNYLVRDGYHLRVTFHDDIIKIHPNSWPNAFVIRTEQSPIDLLDIWRTFMLLFVNIADSGWPYQIYCRCICIQLVPIWGWGSPLVLGWPSIPICCFVHILLPWRNMLILLL